MPGCLIHDFHGESYTRPERGKQGMVIVMIQTPTVHTKASQYAGLFCVLIYVAIDIGLLVEIVPEINIVKDQLFNHRE